MHYHSHTAGTCHRLSLKLLQGSSEASLRAAEATGTLVLWKRTVGLTVRHSTVEDEHDISFVDTVVFCWSFCLKRHPNCTGKIGRSDGEDISQPFLCVHTICGQATLGESSCFFCIFWALCAGEGPWFLLIHPTTCALLTTSTLHCSDLREALQ